MSTNSIEFYTFIVPNEDEIDADMRLLMSMLSSSHLQCAGGLPST